MNRMPQCSSHHIDLYCPHPKVADTRPRRSTATASGLGRPVINALTNKTANPAPDRSTKPHDIVAPARSETPTSYPTICPRSGETSFCQGPYSGPLTAAPAILPRRSLPSNGRRSETGSRDDVGGHDFGVGSGAATAQ